MKTKIIYFTLGAITVIISILIGRSTTLTAQDDKSIATFDTVVVKGKLMVGNNDNKIVLEGNEKQALCSAIAY